MPFYGRDYKKNKQTKTWRKVKTWINTCDYFFVGYRSNTFPFWRKDRRRGTRISIKLIRSFHRRESFFSITFPTVLATWNFSINSIVLSLWREIDIVEEFNSFNCHLTFSYVLSSGRDECSDLKWPLLKLASASLNGAGHILITLSNWFDWMPLPINVS